jgi:hypothetical protein
MMGEVLEPLSAHDWSVAAGTFTWTCRETLAHIGHDLLAYAAQVAGRVQDAYLPLDLVIRHDAPVADVLPAVEACGGLLVAALAGRRAGDAGVALRVLRRQRVRSARRRRGRAPPDQQPDHYPRPSRGRVRD